MTWKFKKMAYPLCAAENLFLFLNVFNFYCRRQLNPSSPCWRMSHSPGTKQQVQNCQIHMGINRSNSWLPPSICPLSVWPLSYQHWIFVFALLQPTYARVKHNKPQLWQQFKNNKTQTKGVQNWNHCKCLAIQNCLSSGVDSPQNLQGCLAADQKVSDIRSLYLLRFINLYFVRRPSTEKTYWC